MRDARGPSARSVRGFAHRPPLRARTIAAAEPVVDHTFIDVEPEKALRRLSRASGA